MYYIYISNNRKNAKAILHSSQKIFSKTVLRQSLPSIYGKELYKETLSYNNRK